MIKLAALILAALVICPAAAAENETYLQVIAATDLAADQEYKLTVRDWALQIASEGERAGMEEELNRRAAEAGRAGDIRVEWGVFQLYGGARHACRVTVGPGCGRNWFGLLYPDTPPEGGEIIYYSAIMNWLAEVFRLF